MIEPNSIRNWPQWLPRSLDYPLRPAGSLLTAAARRYGDRIALRRHDRALSWRQLYEDACRFAHGLRALGIERGDVVAIHLPNRLEFAIGYWGTLLAGATFSPTNPLLPADNLAFQLGDCSARIVITQTSGLPVVTEALAGGQLSQLSTALVVDEPSSTSPLPIDVRRFDDVLDGQPATPPDVPVAPDTDLAHLSYTGGTTGWSKGVRLTHCNVVTNAVQYACWGSGSIPVLDEAGDVTLDQIGPPEEWPVRLGEGSSIVITPWFHAMGNIGGLALSALVGGSGVLHDRFEPGAYLADAERFRVTTLAGAPPLFAALLAHPDFATRDLSTVRGISSGAAPLPVEFLDALRRRLPEAVVGEGYGLTEVTMGATSNPSARSAVRKPGSVGVPVFDTAVKIIDEDGSELPAGQPGEVCLRGPQVMAGYHNRPEETAKVLVDGWLHTGDVGVLDEDGYLRIVDRKKDMLIYKGYNVYPRELEELLYRHPAVAAAAVVGRYDAAVGDLPVAFVVPRSAGTADADELLRFVNEQVVPYKRLRAVRFIDALPVSGAGKILKRQLREQAEQLVS